MARPRGESTGRERLAKAAGRSFRVGGFGGVGVDGLAKEAGLTSGAFYAHFGSKANAFRIALVDGLQFVHDGVKHFQATHGAAWLGAFVDFYLGERLAVDLSEACALPTLTTDAARADNETREAYERELTSLAKTLAAGLPGNNRKVRAWRLLSILTGAAAMARAVTDRAVRDEIVSAAKVAAKSV